MSKRGPAYTPVAVTPEDAFAWGLKCDRCAKVFAEGEEVLTDADAERYFCDEACVRAYEEGEEEAAWEARLEGEPPVTVSERAAEAWRAKR